MAQTDAKAVALDPLSNVVIGCALSVLKTLGVGFLEKVYENALALEMRRRGLAVAHQVGIDVCYRDVVVGQYFADLLVEDALLIELKVARAIDDAHRAQCLNYLRATGLRLCLLLNFGQPRLGIQRIVNGL